MKKLFLIMLMTLILTVGCKQPDAQEKTKNVIKSLTYKNKTIKNVTKSLTYKNKIIFIQKRNEITNSLFIKGKKNAIKNLSSNKYVHDFCITKNGVLYYFQARKDLGYRPIVGTRFFGSFVIKYVDLNDENLIVNNFLRDSTFFEPQKLELNNDEKFLCFADKFGKMYTVNLSTRVLKNFIPKGYTQADIWGSHLSEDKGKFIILINSGIDENAKFIWLKREYRISNMR